jgi:hypothetical protein
MGMMECRLRLAKLVRWLRRCVTRLQLDSIYLYDLYMQILFIKFRSFSIFIYRGPILRPSLWIWSDSSVKVRTLRNATMQFQTPPAWGIRPINKRHPIKWYVQYEEVNQAITSTLRSHHVTIFSKINNASLSISSQINSKASFSE